MSNSNSGRAAREKKRENVALEAYNYLYIRGGELKGLRGRTPREFGQMVSKMKTQVIKRSVLIKSAIKANQNWDKRFLRARKSGKRKRELH